VSKSELPSDESARLAALRSYSALNTEREATFDALTKLAALALDVPIALISLVDEDRHWFKSRYGLDLAETPRAFAFCEHIAAGERVLVVKDATKDPRFLANPLVTGEPHVHFYAGAPLLTPDGFVLGALCAVDQVPREPTAPQLEMLSLLAGQVVEQLEHRRKRHLLAVERAAAFESARRLAVLFDAMVEGVVVQERDGSITEANASAERILGLSLDQISGRTARDPDWRSVHEDGSPFPVEDYPAMVTLRTGVRTENVIVGIHKPGGEVTWISVNSLPISSDEKSPHAVMSTFHDITATKTSQAAAERVARQERFITTGTLAAGVGHEINSPLAYILANLEYSIEELRAIEGSSPSGRLRDLITVLAEARDGAERIRKIVRGLRALARDESEPVAIEVDSTVDIAINIAAHELRLKATVQKEIPPALLVLADESRLTQVLVNLLVNAAQAFPTPAVDKNEIRVTASLESGGRVSIAVGDNGPGIPPHLQRRIFDPFFTTKPVGQGTGLGLSISLGIVEALGGELLLESAPGEGATFRVVLPAAAHAIGTERPPSAVPRRGRLLVIDDEPAILSSIRRVLDKDHEVITTQDARQALALIEAGDRFDVVFCDLMMPHLSGAAFYAEVRSKYPELADRFVFVTGGATESGVKAFLAAVPNERVEKPFSVQNLRGIARRFVDTRLSPHSPTSDVPGPART
jgi:PAS domain S-box-containing protein